MYDKPCHNETTQRPRRANVGCTALCAPLNKLHLQGTQRAAFPTTSNIDSNKEKYNPLATSTNPSDITNIITDGSDAILLNEIQINSN